KLTMTAKTLTKRSPVFYLCCNDLRSAVAPKVVEKCSLPKLTASSSTLATTTDQASLIEIVDELVARTFARIDENPLAAIAFNHCVELLRMFADRLQIACSQIVRLTNEFVPVFKPDEFHHATQLEGQLVMVHHLKQNNLVMIIAQ